MFEVVEQEIDKVDVIDQLASIKVNNDILQHINVFNTYRNFSENYKKLDNLKNFRTEHERKNILERWWHNDKLGDAQLDSAEVQAEFSKTIGQLMMISIMQAKKLAEQQEQLNDQQTGLGNQAVGITLHTSELQEQHQRLADQSAKLENLVREYFELKGLTDRKLIAIANEVMNAKKDMLSEFSERTAKVDELCNALSLRVEKQGLELAEQVMRHVEQTQIALAALREESQDGNRALESAMRTQQDEQSRKMNEGLAMIDESFRSQQNDVLDGFRKLKWLIGFGAGALLVANAGLAYLLWGMLV